MMDFLLENQDLCIKNGDFSICQSEQETLAQRIKIRLKLIRGEWFLDSNIGIPYFTEILGKKIHIEFIKYLILNELKNIFPIKTIKEFLIEQNSDRKLSIKFLVILEDKTQVNINEQIITGF